MIYKREEHEIDLFDEEKKKNWISIFSIALICHCVKDENEKKIHRMHINTHRETKWNDRLD